MSRQQSGNIGLPTSEQVNICVNLCQPGCPPLLITRNQVKSFVARNFNPPSTSFVLQRQSWFASLNEMLVRAALRSRAQQPTMRPHVESRFICQRHVRARACLTPMHVGWGCHRLRRKFSGNPTRLMPPTSCNHRVAARALRSAVEESDSLASRWRDCAGNESADPA